jgi:hypothetical protein
VNEKFPTGARTPEAALNPEPEPHGVRKFGCNTLGAENNWAGRGQENLGRVCARFFKKGPKGSIKIKYSLSYNRLDFLPKIITIKWFTYFSLPMSS